MPPSKARTIPEDLRSDASSSTREKPGQNANAALNAKGRRLGGGLATTSSLRDMTTTGQIASTMNSGGQNGAAQDTNSGVSLVSLRQFHETLLIK
jgi:hypothetical protein